MDASELLIEAYGRIGPLVHRAAEGLDAEGLAFRPEPGSNSIAWLIWHLTRIQDDHIAGVSGEAQVWADRSWVERTGVDRGPEDMGHGDGPDEVASVRPEDPDGLLAYHDAVGERTSALLESLDDAGLDRIVDRRWDPPVTAGVRLASVLSDNLQHAGQALYLRGMVERA